MGGFSYYDEEEFFQRFQQKRNRRESPNNVLEGPAILSLMGDFNGEEVLDLGCGNGQFGVWLLENGAGSYHGVDGSAKMVEQGKEYLQGKKAIVERADLNDIKLEENQYDLVVSRLVFHYLTEVSQLFQKVNKVLKADGKFVFSVQHPVITASMKSAQGKQRTDWIVDDYFNSGERLEPWINQPVKKYHRTTEQYVEELLKAGFKLEGLKEGAPNREYFSTNEEYERRKRIPLVLVLSASK